MDFEGVGGRWGAAGAGGADQFEPGFDETGGVCAGFAGGDPGFEGFCEIFAVFGGFGGGRGGFWGRLGGREDLGGEESGAGVGKRDETRGADEGFVGWVVEVDGVVRVEAARFAQIGADLAD